MDKQLAQIYGLKQQLITLGYHPTQISDIIGDVINNASLKSITEAQCFEIIESLQYYCDFAERCKKGIC